MRVVSTELSFFPDIFEYFFFGLSPFFNSMDYCVILFNIKIRELKMLGPEDHDNIQGVRSHLCYFKLLFLRHVCINFKLN